MQHNRVHDGRQIRVQLRDNNPQIRNSWKQNSRSRFNSGRHFNHHHQGFGPEFHFQTNLGDGDLVTRHFESSAVSNNMSHVTVHGSRAAIPKDIDSTSSGVSNYSMLDSGNYSLPKTSTPEYSSTGPAVPDDTTGPASYVASAPAYGNGGPVVAYPPLSGVGYYTSHPWFAHPYHYPVPLVPGYGSNFSVPSFSQGDENNVVNSAYQVILI